MLDRRTTGDDLFESVCDRCNSHDVDTSGTATANGNGSGNYQRSTFLLNRGKLYISADVDGAETDDSENTDALDSGGHVGMAKVNLSWLLEFTSVMILFASLCYAAVVPVRISLQAVLSAAQLQTLLGLEAVSDMIMMAHFVLLHYGDMNWLALWYNHLALPLTLDVVKHLMNSCRRTMLILPFALSAWSIVLYYQMPTSSVPVRLLTAFAGLKVLATIDIPSQSGVLQRIISVHVIELKQNVFRLINLVGVILLAANAIASVFMYIGLHEMKHSTDIDNWITSSKVMPHVFASSASAAYYPNAALLSLYVHALYWSIATICTVGYGDVVSVTHRERSFNCLAFLVCAALYAMVVVNLQDILAQIDVTSDLQKAKVEDCNELLLREHVTDSLRHRVDAHTKVTWELWKGVHGDKIALMMPAMQYALAMKHDTELSDVLSSLPFFDTLTASARLRYLKQFRLVTYVTKDVLFRSEELPSRLIVLLRGHVQLFGASGPIKGHLISTVIKGALGEAEFLKRKRS